MDLKKINKGANIISSFLSTELQRPINIVSYNYLGEGCHGIAYKAIAQSGETFILKQFSEEGRNLEFQEDRIREALLVKRTGNQMDRHVKVSKIAALHKGNLVTYPEHEPIIIMEEIHYDEYFKDLSEFKKRLTAQQKKRIKIIANYLVEMHAEKQPVKLYNRYLKDWFALGILELVNELPTNQLKLKQKFLEWEHKLQTQTHRCTKVHGEFFPGTIHFTPEDKLFTYDMRRIGAGEAADDVGSMLFNFYAFPLQTRGKITQVYKDAAELFLETYLKKSKDKTIKKYLPCFMAYRCLILANPQIVPMKKDARKKITLFLNKLIHMKKFEYTTINNWF